jgi:hypothetical protein
LVVDAEAAMAPDEHLAGKRRKDRFSPDKEADHLTAEPLGKERFGNRRQRNEASRCFEDVVGDERMHVWIEVDQVAEGLHEEDEARPGARMRGAVRLQEQSGDDAAELSEKRAAVSEERPDQLRNGKDILPVRNGPQQAAFDPLAVGEDALLMAARAEVAGVAGEGEPEVVAARAAADACEATVQIAAPPRKRSSTFSSTARRTRPAARSSGKWRLTHCQSGLARGLRWR